MVDLQHLRRTIAKAAADGEAAIVTTRWLKEVEQDLAELVQRRQQAQRA